MRFAHAFIALAAIAAGCGDDTTSSTGADLSIAHDMATGSAPTCAAYCAKIQMNCTGADAGSNQQYASEAACNSYCTSAAAWPAGMIGDLSGNTVGCRLYHAGAAAADPVLHCPHAGPTGGNVCGSWCDNYCQLMAKNCTGANAVYDPTTCMSKCAMLGTQGHANDTTGNTVQCRIYYLGLAATDPTACANAKQLADNASTLCQ